MKELRGYLTTIWRRMEDDEAVDDVLQEINEKHQTNLTTVKELEKMVLSEKEMKFVKKVRKAGYFPRMYSGRGMFGALTPAIETNSPTENPYGKPLRWDNLGLNYILYL